MTGYLSNSGRDMDCCMAFFVFLLEDSCSGFVSYIADYVHSFVHSVGHTVGG